MIYATNYTITIYGYKKVGYISNNNPFGWIAHVTLVWVVKQQLEQKLTASCI